MWFDFLGILLELDDCNLNWRSRLNFERAFPLLLYPSNFPWNEFVPIVLLTSRI